MKALIKEAAVESYVLKEMDTPEPKGDEVLIKVTTASGLCYVMYQSSFPCASSQLPVIFFSPVCAHGRDSQQATLNMKGGTGVVTVIQCSDVHVCTSIQSCSPHK